MESLSRTTRKVDGRYEVALFGRIQLPLCQTRVVAEKRFELLEKRLEKDPQLQVKYTETKENDLQKRYIKKLEDQELAAADAHKW